MSSVHLAFSSDRAGSRRTRPAGVGRVLSDLLRPVSSLREGARAVVVEVHSHDQGRTDRLLALGVTPGAIVVVLQTFPGIVMLCDQTELAIERQVADAILVRPQESRS